jgi:hypothetical protein
VSNNQFAFIHKSKVPSQGAWQAAIDSTGFDFQLDPSLKPFEDEGYRPCKLFSADAGFEIFYGPAAEIFEEPEELAALAGDRDYCITMNWGGEMRDCAAVMIASYALAKNFGAAISYEGDEVNSLEELLRQTNEIVNDARNDS